MPCLRYFWTRRTANNSSLKDTHVFELIIYLPFCALKYKIVVL